VNRTVGLTLRRTAGGGVIFALGFGAFSAGPHQLVALSAASAVVPQRSPVSYDDDRVVPRPTRTAVIIYTEATAEASPTPARATARPAVQRAAAARAPAGPAWAVGSVSGAGNGFTYGYCTWWVAHKRYVPWSGNAWQWWYNAQQFGFAEGQVPMVGAIMVQGISWASPVGHVAYVESVNGDGSFTVSEMNYGGWGRVDYRTIKSTAGLDLLGFIY